MRSVLLVTEQDVVKYTQLSGNFDQDKITPFIKTAQDIEIQSVLGGKLYDAIQDKIAAGTLTGHYLTLVTDFIQPCLIQYAMADLLLFHGFEISNAGVLRNFPESTTVPDVKDVNYLVQRHRMLAESYRLRLVDHLCYYSQLYPEYNEGQEGGQYPDHSDSNYQSGLNIY